MPFFDEFVPFSACRVNGPLDSCGPKTKKAWYVSLARADMCGPCRFSIVMVPDLDFPCLEGTQQIVLVKCLFCGPYSPQIFGTRLEKNYMLISLVLEHRKISALIFNFPRMKTY